MKNEKLYKQFNLILKDVKDLNLIKDVFVNKDFYKNSINNIDKKEESRVYLLSSLEDMFLGDEKDNAIYLVLDKEKKNVIDVINVSLEEMDIKYNTNRSNDPDAVPSMDGEKDVVVVRDITSLTENGIYNSDLAKKEVENYQNALLEESAYGEPNASIEEITSSLREAIIFELNLKEDKKLNNKKKFR